MRHNGSCLCGAVRFEVAGALPKPDACHCRECRKFSGHFFVSTDVPKADLEIAGRENITWFQSSAKVRRGFCKICGASLFFDPLHHDWTGIAMGAFEGATRTGIAVHIFTGEKGDYYAIAKEERQFARIPTRPDDE